MSTLAVSVIGGNHPDFEFLILGSVFLFPTRLETDGKRFAESPACDLQLLLGG